MGNQKNSKFFKDRVQSGRFKISYHSIPETTKMLEIWKKRSKITFKRAHLMAKAQVIQAC